MKYNKELTRTIEDVAEVAGHLWAKGWAERNGGNISCNITDYVGHSLNELDPISEPRVIGRRMANLEGAYFLVTGTGKRMRYVASSPMDNVLIIRISNDLEHYEIIAENSILPTSELSSHLAVHDFLIASNSNSKAVIHTHPSDLVAMSHNPAFLTKDVLSRLLWSMIPETRLFCPKGLGIVPYALPGSMKLADATIEQLREYDVVLWEKHGVLAVGNDIIEAFDMIDTLSKSAHIYISARSMGFIPSGMSEAQMDELKDAFNL